MPTDPSSSAACLYWWLRRTWGRTVDAYWDRQARKHPVELHPVREINLLNRLDAALADRRGFVVHYICCGREWLQPQTFSTWEPGRPASDVVRRAGRRRPRSRSHRQPRSEAIWVARMTDKPTPTSAAAEERDYLAARAAHYAADARNIVARVRLYEDVHPDDAPCLESLLRAFPDIAWRGHDH